MKANGWDSLSILFFIFDAAADVCLETFKDVIVLWGNIPG